MDAKFDILWGVFSLLLGASVGSFLNVLIYRMPLGQSVIAPHSRCPHCGHAIRAYDNIPVLSFLLLRARCRDCGGSISIRYPFVELATALCYLGLYLELGPTPALGVFSVLCAALIAVFFIDLDHMIIPDAITLNFIPIGLVSSIVGVLPGMNWKTSFTGMIAGGAVLYIPALVYRLVRGVEGLGGGDVKLLAMMGTFLGPVGVIFVMLVSSLTGSIVGILGMAGGKTDSTSPIPFGPFLVIGGVLYVFLGPEIVEALFGFAPAALFEVLFGSSSRF